MLSWFFIWVVWILPSLSGKLGSVRSNIAARAKESEQGANQDK